MEFINIIISGIAGAAVMTVFTYLLTFITDHVFKVTQILGTMITFRTTEDGKLSNSTLAAAAGIAGHYATGIFFALCYLLLWKKGVGEPDLFHALLFGVINGIVGILIWKTFFTIHPNPPSIKLRSYLLSLMIAHILFGLTVVYTYRLLQSV